MPDFDLTAPITRESVEAAILWDRAPYNRIPDGQRLIVVDYHVSIAGIEDSFDQLDGKMIRACSEDAAAGKGWTYPLKEAQGFIAAHFQMLSTWHDALDALDAELRGHVAAGDLPEWAQELVKLEAFGLFGASYALLRAVAEYHHGAAGPALSKDYDFAYELSNSVVNPFT
jgi:hypothetical protein